MKNTIGNMGVIANTFTGKSINSPQLNASNIAMKKIFHIGPGGNTVGLNDNFIKDLVIILTPIITVNVIKNLCDKGCIDPYCCYYYTDQCCGDNNVKNLNNNLKNFLNSSTINDNDNDFSLLSTEIFEDTTENNDTNQLQSNLIQSIESINLNDDNDNDNDNNDNNNDDDNSFLNNSN